MEQIPQGKYTAEFREEAVKLVESGLSEAEVGRRLQIPKSSLHNWVSTQGRQKTIGIR